MGASHYTVIQTILAFLRQSTVKSFTVDVRNFRHCLEDAVLLHFSLKYLSRGEEDNSLRSVCTPFSDTSFVSLVTFDKVIDRFLALFLFLFIAQSHENNQRTRRCSLVSDSHLSVVEMSFCYLNFSQSTLGLLWTVGNQLINEICNCLKSFTLSYYRK